MREAEEDDRGGSPVRHRAFPECKCSDIGKGGCRCEDDGTFSHYEWARPRWKWGAE